MGAELAREKQARAELEGRPPQEALNKLIGELALEKLARSELEARFSPDPQHNFQSELERERQLREEVEAKHAEELAFHQRAAQAATDALAAAQSGEPVPQANTAQLKRLAAEKSEYERQLRDALNA